VQTRGKTGLAKVGRLRDSADCHILQNPGFDRYVSGPPSRRAFGVSRCWASVVSLDALPRTMRGLGHSDMSVMARSRLYSSLDQ